MVQQLRSVAGSSFELEPVAAAVAESLKSLAPLADGALHDSAWDDFLTEHCSGACWELRSQLECAVCCDAHDYVYTKRCWSCLVPLITPTCYCSYRVLKTELTPFPFMVHMRWEWLVRWLMIWLSRYRKMCDHLKKINWTHRSIFRVLIIITISVV